MGGSAINIPPESDTSKCLFQNRLLLISNFIFKGEALLWPDQKDKQMGSDFKDTKFLLKSQKTEFRREKVIK